MSSTFAVGRKAFGFCDRCGFRYPLRELKEERKNLNRTGLRTCPACFDGDHPQLQLGRYHWNDPQALRNPRPDISQLESRHDDTHRWDFETDTEGWVNGNNAVVTWDSTEEALKVVPTGPLHFLYKGASIGIDTSEYKYVRMLMKPITPFPWSDWVGRVRIDGVSSGNVNILRPPLQMGNQEYLLTWEVKDNADWTGTTNVLEFRLGGSNDDYYAKYITVEKQ